MRQSPSVYSVSLRCIPKATLYSTPSPVILHGFGQACKWQMDSGRPSSPHSPCLIHEQGSVRCPSSHTMSETHSAPCTRAPHTPPLQTSSFYPLKPPWHFHFMCRCAPILPGKESDNSNSRLQRWRNTRLKCNPMQHPARRQCSISHSDVSRI